jgi:predicted nucleic acid-binding Zn ribbon protein
LNYLKEALKGRESLFSQDNLQLVQRLQSEKEALELQKTERSKENARYIQLLLIALFVVGVVLTLLVLSKQQRKQKWAKNVGFFAILLVMEFLTFVIGDLIDGITNDFTIAAFIATICLAALLTPLDRKMENWVNKNLTVARKRRQSKQKTSTSPTQTS